MADGQSTIEQARELVDEIVRLARAHDDKALTKIDSEPSTGELLGLLPEREARQAEAHLKAARVWKARQNLKAREKLDAARNEIDELDITLARGILRKIDWEVLDEAELERYNELTLALEARAIELEDIQSQLPETPPEVKKSRFWRR